MKYQLNYDPTKDPGQSFTPYSDEWTWDADNECPVVTGKRDDQALIQSQEDCALDKIFDRLMPDEQSRLWLAKREEYDDSAPVEAEPLEADIDRLNRIASEADEMRDRYGFPEDWTASQVFNKVMEIYENGNSGRNSVDPGKVGADHIGDPGVSTDGQVPPVENTEQKGGE